MTCAWRSRRSRIGIKFIDPMNRTYGVEFPEYQNTENPKYQKSKVPNTFFRRAKSGGISLRYTSGYTVAMTVCFFSSGFEQHWGHCKKDLLREFTYLQWGFTLSVDLLSSDTATLAGSEKNSFYYSELLLISQDSDANIVGLVETKFIVDTG